MLRAQEQMLSVTVFEAAMGPMIGASIVAMDHELDPPLDHADGRHRYSALIPHGPRMVAFAEFLVTDIGSQADKTPSLPNVSS